MKTKEGAATPGPWIADDRHIHPLAGLTYPAGIEPETDVIVMVDTDCHRDGLLNQTDKANLRLIAAAPDLLMAAEAIYEQGYNLSSDVHALLGAAIAKAKGAHE